MRRHRKVWLWWGRWWAAQIYINRYVSLGIHVDFNKPYVDLHFLWLIVSIGDNPGVTSDEGRKRWSCRGFLFTDDPVL